MKSLFTCQRATASGADTRTQRSMIAKVAALICVTLPVLALLAAAGPVATANAGGGSRVVVASPTPGGTEIPIGANERVGAATAVALPGGVVVAVIRVDQMPAKPDFNVVSDNGGDPPPQHPYKNDEDWTWSAQSIHNPDGTETVVVTGRHSGGGTATITHKNSHAEPDPPQPPGLRVWCPDALPVDPVEESLVLAAVGMLDLPGPQVFHVPSGDFCLQSDLMLEPETINMRYVDTAVARLTASIPPRAPISTGLWTEDFDSYALGSSLHGQGGWKGWGDDPNFDALVTDVQAHSEPHAVDVVGDTDLVHEYENHTSGKWVYSAWQYIPSDFVGGGEPPFVGSFFVMMNTYDDAGPVEEDDWSVQMNFDSNDGMLKVYYGNGMNTVDVPYETDRWVEIQVRVDLDNDWTQIYYDGELVTGYRWTGGVLGGGSGTLEIAAVDLFANGSTSVYYDDLTRSLRPTRTRR